METQTANLLKECEAVIKEIFIACRQKAPHFDVTYDCFKASLQKTVHKYLFSGKDSSQQVTAAEVKHFLNEIQADDLFIALTCRAGNEYAWQEFDRDYRNYLERVARHLTSSESFAQDAVGLVYGELYGTRIIDGERISKLSSYSGRGSLRGWLRTVVWHCLVDLQRQKHKEISLDDLTEMLGEGGAQASFAEPSLGGEREMLDHLMTKRYSAVTLSAIKHAFMSLEDHQKLLLLYYHVENLKLRQIAALCQTTTSPLHPWFQRKSAARKANSASRIHESTVLRWLEKTYSQVLRSFRHELAAKHNLQPEEIEMCLELAEQDLAKPNLYRKLLTTC